MAKMEKEDGEKGQQQFDVIEDSPLRDLLIAQIKDKEKIADVQERIKERNEQIKGELRKMKKTMIRFEDDNGKRSVASLKVTGERVVISRDKGTEKD